MHIQFAFQAGLPIVFIFAKSLSFASTKMEGSMPSIFFSNLAHSILRSGWYPLVLDQLPELTSGSCRNEGTTYSNHVKISTMQKQLSLLFHGLTMRKETENYSSKDQRVRSKEKSPCWKSCCMSEGNPLSAGHTQKLSYPSRR